MWPSVTWSTWLWLGCCCSVGHIGFFMARGEVISSFAKTNLPSRGYWWWRNSYIGKQIDVLLGRWWEYLLYTNNPIAQLFYLGLISLTYGIFIFRAYPLLPLPYLPLYTRWTSLVLVLLCLLSFVVVSCADPGIITPANADSLELLYPYDDIYFTRGRNCTTCGTARIARSKHCRVCDHCVARFDHHCIWIANCVGAGNYHFFLTFLGLHVLLTAYGIVGLTLLFQGIIHQKRLWQARYFEASTRRYMAASWRLIGMYLMQEHSGLLFVYSASIVFGVALAVFFLYQFYQTFVWRNTTNERNKYRNLQSKIKELRQQATKLQDDPTFGSAVVGNENCRPPQYAPLSFRELCCPQRWLGAASQEARLRQAYKVGNSKNEGLYQRGVPEGEVASEMTSIQQNIPSATSLSTPRPMIRDNWKRGSRL